MVLLTTGHALAWSLRLTAEGYTGCELRDENGVRWGWTINTGATGWTAHTGAWGQADLVGGVAPPIPEEIETFATLDEAKAWIEERVAHHWKNYVTRGAPT